MAMKSDDKTFVLFVAIISLAGIAAMLIDKIWK